MTYYVALVVLLLLCFYLGQVFGLLIHCDNCSDFQEVRRYVYLVPFLKIALAIHAARQLAKDRAWKLLVSYFLGGDKSILILDAMVETLPELQKENQRSKIRNIQRRPKVLPLNTLKSILFETQDRVTADFQYM